MNIQYLDARQDPDFFALGVRPCVVHNLKGSGCLWVPDHQHAHFGYFQGGCFFGSSHPATTILVAIEQWVPDAVIAGCATFHTRFVGRVNKQMFEWGDGVVPYKYRLTLRVHNASLGKLRDGRVVAVKRLYENNCKKIEQFMNEIQILAGLHHQNLICLYGCTTHHGRELLLVYEYIPNGTVADHLHGENSSPGSLPWTTRMSIAIVTASALVYLHHSDVIRRDVKTNNILLDKSFTVKVADFGLSRLFPDNVTHVSTAPQGTPGYVDPEYHECYQLTSKSDVYSFMVIRNDAVHELVDPNLGFETDYEVRKMVHGVAELAFQCLQNERDCRPSMDEVLEGLKGIKNGYEKSDVLDGTSDDAVLLKNPSQAMSPDSVAIAWSTSTMSTSSG
ncbi:hypothetical protein OSB04_014592 [Centaurea solstitialis]|uniref:Protein kinase domain-containing protein n=1 Tax=Centaurea solstitialis TaxID=347529 RepID=A0AA38W859_9ASTR|nr:hypothetical protein OSB04_014592 [Centaurea solstitialis]